MLHLIKELETTYCGVNVGANVDGLRATGRLILFSTAQDRCTACEQAFTHTEIVKDKSRLLE